ncbi:interferon-induced protein 44-like [Tachysurus ichikawai]
MTQFKEPSLQKSFDLKCYSVSVAKFQRPWTSEEWREKAELLTYVKDFNPSTEVLRILLYGPVGSGKSCFINSVQRVLLGRNVISALESSALTGTSFTKKLNIHKLKKGRRECYPLEIVDIMGIESSGGIKPEDVNGQHPEARGEHANSAHTRRRRESNPDPGEIPQVIVMTKVDKACELVKEDLKKVYYSKKIKDKVVECSNNVGIPLNAIYPVKNYAESITQDPDTDVLILTALRDILHFADDYVEREMERS